MSKQKYEYYLKNVQNNGVYVMQIADDKQRKLPEGELNSYEVPALVDYSMVNSWTSDCLGHALTVLDAVISDPKQNKAAKDIMKQRIYSLMNVQNDFMNPGYDSTH